MTTKIKINNGSVQGITQEIYLNSLKEKNIININGCFCPPHKGHYNMIKNNILSAIETIGENIDCALISFTSFGNNIYNSRHGVPYEQSLNMMILYLSKLSKELNVTFFLQKDKDSYFGSEVPISEDGKILINKMVDVLSFENNESQEEKEKNIRETIFKKHNVKNFAFNFPRGPLKNIIFKYSDYIKKQLEEKIIIVESVRDLSGPSATKFTRFLRKNIPFEEINKDEINFFLPDTLTNDEKRSIITTIQSNYYNKATFKECLKNAQQKPRIKVECIKFYPNVENFVKTHFPELEEIKIKKLTDQQINSILDKIIEEGYEE